MLCLVNAHGLGNAGFILVAGLDFPALLQFDQRQAIGRVAIYLVGGGENEDRLGTGLAGGLQQVERADRVDTEIGVRVPAPPSRCDGWAAV